MVNKKEEQQENSTNRVDRQQKIVEIVQAELIYTQTNIVEALEERGIFASQGTVSRDLENLNINKGGTNQSYQVSSNAIKQIHVNELQSMMKEKQHIYYPNVSYQYLKTEKGKASVYAFHLQQAFPDVILDVTIGMDSLVLLINMDAETHDFLDLLQNI
jgi:transcriptional regulator of arginine metabolism